MDACLRPRADRSFSFCPVGAGITLPPQTGSEAPNRGFQCPPAQTHR